MKKKAFTLVETLVVAFICIGIASIIAGISIIGRDNFVTNSAYADVSQAARLGLERMVNELNKSNGEHIKVQACGTADPCSDCDEGDLLVWSSCSGKFIFFQMPVVTSDPIADTLYQPSGKVKWGAEDQMDEKIWYYVSDSGKNQNRLMRRYSYTSGGQRYYIDKVVADNIDNIDFTAVPDSNDLQMLKLSITAKKNIFLTGREMETTLTSALTFRN
jgi:type II secretory pathway pseudopilin PulG